jgi:glycosyltransferase involved in cell wall biosynthesis
VVLSTSQFEGYGAGIVEALAAGVPVVAPDVGIAREAGAIVVPREELAGAVMKVLEHGMKGELRIKPPDKEEWTRRWKETL